MCLLEQLERYEPYNEQEARDRALLLRALREEADVFTRENDRMHMTASAWVTNEAHDRVLMAYHNIYDSWAWLGGHAAWRWASARICSRSRCVRCGRRAV